ncbi:unnamed protein product [Orchesella dallaii]|uniref:Uncharacterized protein n=1 Tax=Orchesella dallaii TaxID=48710 RepID=A0ABP1QJU6_9HEXA
MIHCDFKNKCEAAIVTPEMLHSFKEQIKLLIEDLETEKDAVGSTKKYNPSSIESFMEFTATLMEWSPYGTLEPTNSPFTISQAALDTLYQYRNPRPVLSYGHGSNPNFAYAPPSYRYPPMQGATSGQPQYRFNTTAMHAASRGLHHHHKHPLPMQGTTKNNLQHQGQHRYPPPLMCGATGAQSQHRYLPPLMHEAIRHQPQHPYQRLPIQITARAHQYHRNHEQAQQIVPPAPTVQNSIHPSNCINPFGQLRNNIDRKYNNLRILHHKFQQWK